MTQPKSNESTVLCALAYYCAYCGKVLEPGKICQAPACGKRRLRAALEAPYNENDERYTNPSSLGDRL